MSKVQIYSTTWCAYCVAEKRFLESKGVKYEDIDIEKDEDNARIMIEKSGQMGVPYTIITHDDGTTTGRVGFDQNWLTDELKLA